MKKQLVILLISAVILSCTATKTVKTTDEAVGIKQKTSNPNNPYIYKNGYKNWEIKPNLIIQDADSTYLNELRFNAVFSAMYTQKLMFDKYGKWDKEIWLEGDSTPILIWENRQLIDSNPELFNVAATGTESITEMFASVNVFDSKKQDCFSQQYPAKDTLIHFFATAIRNLKSNHTFYTQYWKLKTQHSEEQYRTVAP